MPKSCLGREDKIGKTLPRLHHDDNCVYLDVMRTTITIEDRLLRQAKQQAAMENCTLGDVVNHALRSRLAEDLRSRKDRLEERPLKTYGGAGLQPGVDLSDSAALGELMDGN